MKDCLDYCEDGTAEFDDPRTPPLDEGKCLCRECAIDAWEQLKDEAEEQVSACNQMVEMLTERKDA